MIIGGICKGFGQGWEFAAESLVEFGAVFDEGEVVGVDGWVRVRKWGGRWLVGEREGEGGADRVFIRMEEGGPVFGRM